MNFYIQKLVLNICLMQELERHFYSSKHKGLQSEAPAAQVQQDLKTLYKLAADVP